MKGEFIPNCERGGTLIYLNSSKHSSRTLYDNKLSDGHFYSMGNTVTRGRFVVVVLTYIYRQWKKKGKAVCLLSPIRLYLRCTKLPTDIQTKYNKWCYLFRAIIQLQECGCLRSRFRFLMVSATMMTKHLRMEIRRTVYDIFGLLPDSANISTVCFYFHCSGDESKYFVSLRKQKRMCLTVQE